MTERLAEILATVPAQLAAISDEDAARRPAPDRWALKEILGHLIDSAANNHQRFVRGQLVERLDDPSYEQERWVAVQHYLTESWPDLVNLWLLLNRHLLHIMRNVDQSKLETPISIRGDATVPLSQVMTGYVSHLEHHLGQILPGERRNALPR
jgi:uncharacterized damage-inducible protein DinB